MRRTSLVLPSLSDAIPGAEQVLDSAPLRGFAARVLRAKGMDPLHASTGADILVRTSMRGFESHGVWLLPLYAELLDRGGIVKRPDLSVTRVGPAAAILDGGGGMGPVVAHTATMEAIEIARTTGIGIVTVRNSNHLGAAGHFALMCAEANMIGIVSSNSPPYMTLFNSRGAVMGNNPLAYGVPVGDGHPPIVMDMSLSKIAGRKVFMAAERDMPIPEGWIVDKAGRATTDPSQLALGGALLPFSGHKGSGLAILLEVLTGVLSGGAITPEVVDFMKDKSRPAEICHVIIAIDPNMFGGPEFFSERIADLSEHVKSAAVLPGDAALRMPGEAAAAREERARTTGIHVPWEVWQSLRGLSEALGLEVLLATAMHNEDRPRPGGNRRG